MTSLIHLHLAVNAKINPSFSELPREKAQEFVNKLMRITNMKPLGPLNWSDAVDLDFPGQSFVQMITTSHCSLHFFADTHEVYFDLYSCKEYDPQKVIGLLDEFFGGIKEYHGILYNRANDGVPKVQKLGNQVMVMKAK
ncbi:MAG: S-adenosylmethionine decarboxylase [Candidatus Micrarchaeia archaeon]